MLLHKKIHHQFLTKLSSFCLSKQRNDESNFCFRIYHLFLRIFHTLPFITMGNYHCSGYLILEQILTWWNYFKYQISKRLLFFFSWNFWLKLKCLSSSGTSIKCSNSQAISSFSKAAAKTAPPLLSQSGKSTKTHHTLYAQKEENDVSQISSEHTLSKIHKQVYGKEFNPFFLWKAHFLPFFVGIGTWIRNLP